MADILQSGWYLYVTVYYEDWILFFIRFVFIQAIRCVVYNWNFYDYVLGWLLKIYKIKGNKRGDHYTKLTNYREIK